MRLSIAGNCRGDTKAGVFRIDCALEFDTQCCNGQLPLPFLGQGSLSCLSFETSAYNSDRK